MVRLLAVIAATLVLSCGGAVDNGIVSYSEAVCAELEACPQSEWARVVVGLHGIGADCPEQVEALARGAGVHDEACFRELVTALLDGAACAGKFPTCDPWGP